MELHLITATKKTIVSNSTQDWEECKDLVLERKRNILLFLNSYDMLIFNETNIFEEAKKFSQTNQIMTFIFDLSEHPMQHDLDVDGLMKTGDLVNDPLFRARYTLPINFN